MRTNITTAVLALSLFAFSAAAQIPRIKTSAPPEKTARVKSAKDTPKADASASKKKDVPVGKEDLAKSRQSQDGKGRRSSQPKDVDHKKPASGKNAIVSVGNQEKILTLKTNLAYDIFAVMNLGVEFQVAPKFTVSLPVAWSLWDWKQSLGLRTVAFQPEARYWLGEPGQGSAFGVNLGVATYNFRHHDIRYQDTGRPLLSASLTYAYILRFDSRWSLEFSLAAGYVNTKYNRYYNIDNGALIDSRTRNYIGPTNVGISLCYSLSK